MQNISLICFNQAFIMIDYFQTSDYFIETVESVQKIEINDVIIKKMIPTKTEFPSFLFSNQKKVVFFLNKLNFDLIDWSKKNLIFLLNPCFRPIYYLYNRRLLKCKSHLYYYFK